MNKPELYPLADVPIEEIAPEELHLVNDALHNTDFPYRTAAGIEKDTGLAPERVASILSHAGIARETVYTSDGQSVYAAADLKKPFRERAAEVLWLLAH